MSCSKLKHEKLYGSHLICPWISESDNITWDFNVLPQNAGKNTTAVC